MKKNGETELDIGGKMMEIMKAKEISQTELAGITGLTKSHLSHIKHNNRIPSVETLIKIADALCCRTDVLLGRFKK